jgi:lysophospholipase L1-like esterase
MLRNKLFIAVWIILLLTCIEALSYFILPDVKLDRIDSISIILEQEPVLFWRVRPHLNTEFQGVKVVTNSLGLRSKEFAIKKEKNVYRIIVLGESPTFGWGVNFENTYAYLLERKLSNDNLKKKIEVINASQIGYTSYQGLILLQNYLLKYSPDLVTIPYVLNDIDVYRFYRNEGISDKELSVPSHSLVMFSNVIDRSRFVVALKNFMKKIINSNDRIAVFYLKKQFKLAKTRVSAEDYKANLLKIINICNANNIKVVFLKMPVNLSLPSLSDQEKKLLMDGNSCSDFYYDLAQNYDKQGKYHQARFYYNQAREYKILDCYAQSKVYHSIVDEVSKKNNVPLVDVDALFVRTGTYQELFNGLNDSIHPNSRGHEIIAEALSDTIKSVFLKN